MIPVGPRTGKWLLAMHSVECVCAGDAGVTLTCSLVWAFCTYSRPTLILGVRMARLNSTTLMPSRWHSFWAAVSSGMEAWSVFFSLLKEMFPNCSTDEITFIMPGGRDGLQEAQKVNYTWLRTHFLFLFIPFSGK